MNTPNPLIAAATLAALSIVSPRRLFIADDEQTVVEEGNPRAAILAVGADCETSDPRVLEYLGVKATLPADPANAAPVFQQVEKEQSPTTNQERLEAASITPPSPDEAVAEAKKAATDQATGEESEPLTAAAKLTADVLQSSAAEAGYDLVAIGEHAAALEQIRQAGEAGTQAATDLQQATGRAGEAERQLAEAQTAKRKAEADRDKAKADVKAANQEKERLKNENDELKAKLQAAEQKAVSTAPVNKAVSGPEGNKAVGSPEANKEG